MIPKSFALVNRTYHVRAYRQDQIADLKCYGDCDRDAGIVRLDMNRVQASREHTFCHELVHAILWASTKPKLSKDEAFVDSVGALLHQYLQTQKGKF